MLVYFILNLVNNKMYVGQTRTSIGRRYAGDYSKRASNDHLAAAYSHYGRTAFVSGPLRYCETKEELDFWEQHYIELYETLDREKGYNKDLGGYRREVSEDLRKRFSQAQKRLCEDPERRRTLKIQSDRYWGDPKNREAKSLAMKDVCNLPEKRLANAVRQGGKPFDVMKQGKHIGTWINKRECGELLGLDRRKILACLQGKRRSHGGYTFQWL